MNISQKQSGLIIGIVIALFLVLGGCGQEEIQKLRSENESLKNKVVSLELEISKLKEAAEYHYQQGVSFLSANKYEDAKIEFETIIEKYPLSQLVTSAKQQLVKVKDVLAKIEAQRIAEEKQLEAQRRDEERRRQEEEKYRPRSPEEAIAEWKRFRNNEDKYKGTVTTWSFRVCDTSGGNTPIGFLDEENRKFMVGLLGPDESLTYGACVMLGKATVVGLGDQIVVTGKFSKVSYQTNGIALIPIRIKNEGYK